MNKKYQIFVSSTFLDLVVERQAVSRSILDLGHIPAGMEMFPASDEEQLSYIKKVIDECDYYLLIIGARYGSEDEEGVSYTEREYQYAKQTGKPILAFIHENIDELPIGKSDKNSEKQKKLESFIKDVSSGRLVQFWKSSDDLKAKSIISLSKAFSNQPQVGWVRADTVASSDTMAEVIKYRRENDELRRNLEAAVAQNMPNFDDAADLNTKFEIKYKYSTGYQHPQRQGILTLTYLDLVKCLGEQLHTPSTKASVKGALKAAMKERFGRDHYKTEISDATIEDILMHLSATGHVKFWPTRLENGRNVTAYQLTPKGVKEWTAQSYTKNS